jgi:Mn2+/Fe2+ NRAMP family transporter
MMFMKILKRLLCWTEILFSAIVGVLTLLFIVAFICIFPFGYQWETIAIVTFCFSLILLSLAFGIIGWRLQGSYRANPVASSNSLNKDRRLFLCLAIGFVGAVTMPLWLIFGHRSKPSRSEEARQQNNRVFITDKEAMFHVEERVYDFDPSKGRFVHVQTLSRYPCKIVSSTNQRPHLSC